MNSDEIVTEFGDLIESSREDLDYFDHILKYNPNNAYVIGCKEATLYALRATRKLSRKLHRENWRVGNITKKLYLIKDYISLLAQYPHNAIDTPYYDGEISVINHCVKFAEFLYENYDENYNKS